MKKILTIAFLLALPLGFIIAQTTAVPWFRFNGIGQKNHPIITQTCIAGGNCVATTTAATLEVQGGGSFSGSLFSGGTFTADDGLDVNNTESSFDNNILLNAASQLKLRNGNKILYSPSAVTVSLVNTDSSGVIALGATAGRVNITTFEGTYFDSHLFPFTTLLSDIGSSTSRFGSTFTRNLDASGTTTAATTTVSLLRFTPLTGTPGIATNRDLWYNDTLDNLSTINPVSTSTQSVVLTNCVNTADSDPIANTNSETQFSLQCSIPANSLKAGKSFKILGAGFYSTTVTPSMTFKLNYGATNLLSFAALTTTSGTVNANWWLDSVVQVRTIGATGTMIAEGFIHNNRSQGTDSSAGTVTVDTTADKNFNISLTWSAASALNVATSTIFSVMSMN